MGRRPFLAGVALVGVGGHSPGRAAGRRRHDDVAIRFAGCRVAIVTGVKHVDTLTVVYFENGRRRERQLSPQRSRRSGRLLVRYSPGGDRTAIVGAGPDIVLHRLVAHGEGTVDQTNTNPRCRPPDARPTADFTFAPERPEAGQTVTFTSTGSDPDGTLVRFEWDFENDGRLDATGREVTHSFDEPGDYTVVHRVRDDTGASDSITRLVSVVPAVRWEQTQQLLPDTVDGRDQFGFSVAADGDTLVVGALGAGTGASGAAYVYALVDGEWRERQRLTASDGMEGDAFGTAVGVHEDTIVVGAPNGDQDPEVGAVYVFEFDGSEWVETTKLSPDGVAADDVFGLAVAITDDILVVGAPADDTASPVGGAAYIFVRDTGGWGPAQRVLPDADGTPNFYGRAVATDGSSVAVGSGFDTTEQFGAVYTYDLVDGDWVEAQKLVPQDAETGARVGSAVSMDPGTLIAGAPADEFTSASGAVYVYAREDGEWSESATLVSTETAGGDLFGRELALDDGRIAVSAVAEDDRAGAVYVYRGVGDDWQRAQRLVPLERRTGGEFGWSVDVTGEFVLVGERDNRTRGPFTGSVYVFRTATDGA